MCNVEDKVIDDYERVGGVHSATLPLHMQKISCLEHRCFLVLKSDKISPNP